ncbi:glycosyltransferase family 4 protein [Flavobacteriaceae bacterium M23B6Z8]
MKRILYIGNKLTNKNQTPTSVEIVGGLLEKEGYHLKYASSFSNKILRFLDMVFSCLKYRSSIDLVLIDTYSTLNFYYACAVGFTCFLIRRPYVCILRGGNLQNRLQNSQFLSAKLFGHARFLIAPSPFLFSVFEKAGYEQLVYIPNSIPLENYTHRFREQVEAKLLWVRSFSHIYNPKMAIDVLKTLQEKGYKAALCMVGPEKDGSMAETKAYAEIQKVKVVFTGRLSKPAWHKIAEEYDIFINTTNIDNTPVSVMEAMALGLPVVSTNVGGIPYLLTDEENALLVPPQNTKAMVAAVEKLISEPKLAKRLSKNARAKVETFDWEAVKGDWKKIIEAC